MGTGKDRIGVLYGGDTAEREISLKSGEAVCAALIRQGYDAALFDVCQKDIEDDLKGIEADIFFNALHGGYGENGTVQRVFEKRRDRFVGSGSEASSKAFDKIAAKEIFQKAGLQTPKWYGPEQLSKNFDKMGSYPIIVKPIAGGSSIGVRLLHDSEELAKTLAEISQMPGEYIAEEYIAGREIAVGVLGEEALEPIEIRPAGDFYDYASKYESPETEYIVPAPLDEAARRAAMRTALAAHRALGCRGVSRVDMILADDGIYYVLEVNTSPGMTERSLLPKAAACGGISFEKLCTLLIDSAKGG